MIGRTIAFVACCLLPGPAQAGRESLPAAVHQDPPIDAGHPASGDGVQFRSHGARVNGQLYRPAGAEPHPTAILLHGLPGNEQNLDLARAMQRQGWTVITFHYRGSWGSGGVFTLRNGVEDAQALLTELRDPERARAWGVDPKRLVLVGHSYGGFVAAVVAAASPDVLGSALIAPWDVSLDVRAFSKLPEADRAKAGAALFGGAEGRLGEATATSLTEDLMRHGAELDLARLAPGLATRPILLLTATRDDPDDSGRDLLAALQRLRATRVTTQLMDTDHGFNDHRIALQAALLSWLGKLPGGPAGR